MNEKADLFLKLNLTKLLHKLQKASTVLFLKWSLYEQCDSIYFMC